MNLFLPSISVGYSWFFFSRVRLGINGYGPNNNITTVFITEIIKNTHENNKTKPQKKIKPWKNLNKTMKVN